MSRSGAGAGEPPQAGGWARPCLRHDVLVPLRSRPGLLAPPAGRAEVPELLRPCPEDGHYPRDPLGLCSRPRRAPKLGEIGRSKKVDIEDNMLDQFLGRFPEKPSSRL